MKLLQKNVNVTEIETDLLAIGIFQDNKETELMKTLNVKLEGAIDALHENGDMQGKCHDMTVLHTLGKIPAKRVLFIGLGTQENYDVEKCRETSGHIIKSALKGKYSNVAIVLPESGTLSKEKIAHATAEGLQLGAYRFAGYAKQEEKPHDVKEVIIITSGQDAEIERGLTTGQAYAQGITTARSLVNEPANYLTPPMMAEKVVQLAQQFEMEYEVLEREDMQKHGMGALLAVAQAGGEDPKLIVVKYQGLDKWDGEEITAYVGKGLTFDTGGYTLKPGVGMEDMKSDMGGAAAVIGALEAIGTLKPQVNILFVIPSSENLISDTAMKSSDVFTAMNGRTIEIISTDAEGRLILADALCYARHLGASRIVDLATLTGGVVATFGDYATGVMTNNQEFVDQVLDVAKEEHEPMWQLPLFPYYKKYLKSDVADTKNSGGRLAHAIQGGIFLQDFVDDAVWVHLDIAGTAYTSGSDVIKSKGGTGVMVRTLVTLAQRLAK